MDRWLQAPTWAPGTRRRGPRLADLPFFCACVLGAAVALLSQPAEAVIKVDLPVSKMVQTAKVVLVGTVVGADANNGTVEVKLALAMKGQAPPERFRVLLSPADALVRRVAAGQPVVVFVGQARAADRAVVHLADTWLQADSVAGADGPAWRAVQPYDGAATFPGRTAALVRILEELRAGKPGIQDWISHEVCVGALRDRGDLGVRPTFLASADLDADQKLDLIVGTASGARLLLAGPEGYADVTERWGLAAARGTRCALGDVNADGNTDLLVGASLWLRAGDRFVQAKAALDLPPEQDWLAVALADATGDNRPDVAVLLRTGRLVVLENPGSPGGQWKASARLLWQDGRSAGGAAFSTEWGDDGGLYVMVVHESEIVRYPAGAKGGEGSDFRRLTGIPLASYPDFGPTPAKVLLTTVWDYDGNGKADLLVVTEGGGVTLANRGFGAFLINKFGHQQLDWRSPVKLPKLPFQLTPDAAVAPGRMVALGKRSRQNLLVLREDGRLFELDNAK